MAKDFISIFDIFGPVMIGPSSSHTAGVSRIAYLAQKIFAEHIETVEITFYGSLAYTYKGHGSDNAVLSGLLGIPCDDERLAFGSEIAKKNNLSYKIISEPNLPEKYHPNTLKLKIENQNGKKLTLIGESIGGGNISIKEINGYRTEISGDYDSILVLHHDERGVIAIVSHILAANSINIASVVSHRKDRGTEALMVVEIDSQIQKSVLLQIQNLPPIYDIVYVPSIKG